MASPPRFPRVVLDVPPDLADEIAYDLMVMGASGVEQRDDATLEHASAERGVTLLASYASDALAAQAVADLDPSFNPRRQDVVGDEWRDGWKEHFKPFFLTPTILVRPPWEVVEPADGVHVLEMDPGRAFGTGLHATTRLVARAIEGHASTLAGREMLDVGCGSGVLALCALVHGATSVRATDNDPEAVSATLENAERNAFENRIQADTAELCDVGATYSFVVANIETRVLVPMAESLMGCVAPGGLLVLSGILRDQREDVLRAYDRLDHVSTYDDGGWIALELRAKP